MQLFSQGKMVGQYNEVTNTFTKHVIESKHLFKKTDSWGIDDNVYRSYILPNKAKIEIIDEKGRKYTTTAEFYQELGKYYEFKPYGKQIFLKREYFKVV